MQKSNRERDGSKQPLPFLFLWVMEHNSSMNLRDTTLVQVLKSLQCWLYQCTEGDVPETALYGLFDTEIRLYLMDKIITALPEYEEADWG